MLHDNEEWFVLDVNPEPWAVGPLGVSRRGGKLTPYMGRNQQLDAYKQAVREQLVLRYPVKIIKAYEPSYELDFLFWRNRADYEGENKRVRKSQVDATNMQKATEDALQGLLIENDRDVVRVTSEIIAQGPDVRGAVAIRLRWGVEPIKERDDVPDFIMEQIRSFGSERKVSSNSWPPR